MRRSMSAPWRPDSNQTASGKPGAVHSLRDRRIVVHHHMRFMPFVECLELKRIFMGPRSQHYLECIEDALGTNDMPILQTRAAYSRFAIVLQRDRKYWKSREIREQPVHGSHSSH